MLVVQVLSTLITVGEMRFRLHIGYVDRQNRRIVMEPARVYRRYLKTWHQVSGKIDINWSEKKNDTKFSCLQIEKVSVAQILKLFDFATKLYQPGLSCLIYSEDMMEQT